MNQQSDNIYDDKNDESWRVWAKYVLKTLENLTSTVKSMETAINAIILQVHEIISNQSKLSDSINKDYTKIKDVDDSIIKIQNDILELSSSIEKLKTEIKLVKPKVNQYIQSKYIKILIAIISLIIGIIASRLLKL